MNIFKKLLSFFLLSIYVLTSAHGAKLHCQDNNHKHAEHSHDHHHHHDHDGSHLISVSHVLFHSVVHFIEHLAHSHDSCLKVLVVDNDNSNNYNFDIAVLWTNRIKFSEFNLKCYSYSIINGYSNVYLINSSLRGPPLLCK